MCFQYVLYKDKYDVIWWIIMSWQQRVALLHVFYVEESKSILSFCVIHVSVFIMEEWSIEIQTKDT